jgi:cold shock CspA family protein
MENGEDVFFHKSGVEKHPTKMDDYGYACLNFKVDEGVEVMFDVTEGQKGPMAVNVKAVGGSDEGSDDDMMESDEE